LIKLILNVDIMVIELELLIIQLIMLMVLASIKVRDRKLN